MLEVEFIPDGRMMPTADNSSRPAGSTDGNPLCLAHVTAVVSAPASGDATALLGVLQAVLGHEPLVPASADDPFAVLQQLEEAAADRWLLVTEEPAAHRGCGNHWCAAVAAFRRPLLFVIPAAAGWEGRARAYGALAQQTGVPLLGVASEGAWMPEGFSPSRDLGLPWIGTFPAEPSEFTAGSDGDEQLWTIRERIHWRWRMLLATGDVLPRDVPVRSGAGGGS